MCSHVVEIDYFLRLPLTIGISLALTIGIHLPLTIVIICT
jgi:hypothetical protein